jgi:predicted  nucleic acid-binding Zn-ribbon protein
MPMRTQGKYIGFSTFFIELSASAYKAFRFSVCPFHTANSLSLPCEPNEVIGMTAYSENVKRIQEQLISIMQDEEIKTAVHILADLIMDIRRTPNDLSGIYFETQRFIPENTQYDESYWMAAYIIYMNGHDFIKLCKEVEAIDEEIILVDEYLQMLDKELQTGQEAIWALYKYSDKLNAFLDKISEKSNLLYKKLSSLKRVKDNMLYDSIRERFYFLDEILHSIEERIEKASREIEEAEKYMGRLEEERKAVKKRLEELQRERWRILDLMRDFIEEIEAS